MSDRMEHARLWLSPRTGGRARKRRPTRGAKRHRFSLEEMQAGAYEFPYLPWIRGHPRRGWQSSSGGSEHGFRYLSWVAPNGVIAVASTCASLGDCHPITVDGLTSTKVWRS